MKIFYLIKDEFLSTISREKLEHFSDGRVYLSEDKYVEHLCGLYLAKYGAKLLGVKNSSIIYENKKPSFKSKEYNISISHSANVVVAAFSKNNVGIDVEYMKDRVYKPILERYKQKIEAPSIDDFYSFWTYHEAVIKLADKVKSKYSVKLCKDYMLTCVSNEIMVSDFEIIKV